MKKLCLITALALAANFAISQDLDEVRKLAYLGQNAKAKEAVDKYLAVEKNAAKADGWFYKGYLLNQLSGDSSKSIEESSAMKTESFETLKKYRQMDAKAPLLEEQNNGPFYQLYNGFASDLAIKAYNAKNIAAAHDNFKKALEVHDYLVANNLAGNNGFKFAALDTIITLYTAITAGELKQPDVAAQYYKKLVDANVSGSDYLDAYQVLTQYYKDKKDKAAFADVLAKGKQLYPTNNAYWTAIEIEEATDGVAKPELFTRYEELMAKYPSNYTVAYNYGVELYNHINSDEAKGTDVSGYKAKLADVLKKAIGIQSTFEANFLLANFLYNNSFDLSEDARKIKSVKPEDVKKKKALEADATKAMNDAIPYGEAALTQFAAIEKPKTVEKVHYKQMLTILKNIYDVKKDAVNSAKYDKLVKAAE